MLFRDSPALNPITRLPISCSSQNIPRPCQWLGKPIHLIHSKQNVPKISIARSSIRAGLEEIFHNDVLVSATVAGLGGQLLKPFVPAVLGKGFNWQLALNSGSMPSSHASSVVATATAIGLERGFSDSLFGFAVVVAGIVMYDAQGVRRAVGKHAEVINMMIISDTPNSVFNRNDQISVVNDGDRVLDSVRREVISIKALEPSIATSQVNVTRAESISGSPKVNSSPKSFQVLEREHIISSFEPVNNVEHDKFDSKEWKKVARSSHTPLKESVGHTKAEVLGGALFGVIVTLGLHLIM